MLETQIMNDQKGGSTSETSWLERQEYTLKGVGMRDQAAGCLEMKFYGNVKKLKYFVKIS